jgi:hypothetical protein
MRLGSAALATGIGKLGAAMGQRWNWLWSVIGELIIENGEKRVRV